MSWIAIEAREPNIKGGAKRIKRFIPREAIRCIDDDGSGTFTISLESGAFYITNEYEELENLNPEME